MDIVLQKIEINLPKSGYLLASCNEAMIDQIVMALDRMEAMGDSPCLLVVRQNQPPNLDHLAWHHELQQEVWLDNLLMRIQKFRSLIKRISTATYPSIFVIEGDCYGPYWDIALACDKRLCFNSDSRMGFPEIADDSFPLGGSLETLFFQEPKALGSLESWRKAPVRSATRALTEGLITYMLPTRDFDAALSRCLESELVSSKSKKLIRMEPTTEPGIEDLTPEIFQDLQARLNRRYGVMSELPPAWRSCSALLDERMKGVKPEAKGTLVGYLVARYMLSSQYLQKLARKFSLEPEFSNKDRARFSSVKVDLGYEVPPSKLMTRLFAAGVELAFYCDEIEPLRAGLEVAYARLERQLGARQASQYWHNWVSLHRGSGFNAWIPRCEFSNDDTLQVACGDDALTYYRLEGNQSRSGVGWVELLGLHQADSQSQALRRLVEAFHDGVIELDRQLPDNFPLTLLVRSFVLQELLAIAAVHPEGLGETVDGLSNMGWGFAGDEVRWERCLLVRHRYDISLLEKLASMNIHLHGEVWHVSSWKEARYSKLNIRDQPKLPSVSAVYVAQHMALFLGELVGKISDDWGLIKNGRNADLAVSEITGFPREWGSPRQFFEHWGRSRAESFAQHHWR